MSSNIKEMRMQLSSEQIKNILGVYGVIPYDENENEIIFPTACHNLMGGSPKLYYYKNEKIFRCYTECNSMFDIFDLLIRMHKLRNNEIGLGQAIALTGVENNAPLDIGIYNDLEYLRKLTNKHEDYETIIRIIDKNVLNRFPYKAEGVQSWLNEGISEAAMKKFEIGYDSFLNAIMIPNHDKDGNLIGIRGRFLNPDSPYKYLPLKSYGETFSHPTGKALYGLYQNQENIKKTKKVIIYEGEKSVLKTEDYLPDMNISVATLGKKITLDHLNLLLPLGISEVILAYDRDYKNKTEREQIIKEWDKITSILSPYFTVSYMIDTEGYLNLKDSPADKGKEIFMDLLKYRMTR